MCLFMNREAIPLLDLHDYLVENVIFFKKTFILKHFFSDISSWVAKEPFKNASLFFSRTCKFQQSILKKVCVYIMVKLVLYVEKENLDSFKITSSPALEVTKYGSCGWLTYY